MQGVNVKSEIGNLKKVILHRPGDELLNLTPNTLEELLFDDIPFLPVAQEEHDAFAKILRDEGVEVVYLEDLMAEVLDAKPELRRQFLDQWIYEAGIRTDMYHDIITDYIESNYPNTKDMVMKTMPGINLQELPQKDTHLLVDMVSDRCKLVCAPMPNLYFTRDPFAMIGNGVSINRNLRMLMHLQYKMFRLLFFQEKFLLPEINRQSLVRSHNSENEFLSARKESRLWRLNHLH